MKLDSDKPWMVGELNDRYITIGPDVWRESQEHPEFEEDLQLYSDWREKASREGMRVRIGRWKIAGNPVAVVLDFTIHDSAPIASAIIIDPNQSLDRFENHC